MIWMHAFKRFGQMNLQLQQEIAAMIDSLEAAGYFQLP
jgi:hypothetical protein